MTPYIPANPGELITSENWNAMQIQIRQDIGKQITQAVGDIKKVDQAGNADKLGGQAPQALEDDIIKQVLEKLAGRTGYQMIFKVLEMGKEKIIKTGFEQYCAVDMYQMVYFPAACATGEDKRLAWVNFYLYNGVDEKKIRFTPTGAAAGTPAISVDIEPSGSQPYKIPCLDMLRRYNVKYDDKSSLEDVVGRFWSNFFSDPNDRFSEDQFGISPWFQRCCREDHSMGELKDRHDLDDLVFQMRPQKTINYPEYPTAPFPSPVTPAGGSPAFPLPHNVQVSHYDFSTLGVKLLLPPVYPEQLVSPNPPLINKDQLKVMLLLKV